MPAGKTDAEAASEFAREGRKSAVQSMKERMSAGTTDAEAASEIAKNCGMANAKRLDELANRDADTKLQCLKCWKLKGIETTKQLPLDTEVWTSGPLKDFPESIMRVLGRLDAQNARRDMAFG